MDTTFALAKDMASHVRDFAPDVQVVYDPNHPLPEGMTWPSKDRDPVAGYVVLSVAADTPDETVGNYTLLGRVDGRDLAFPTSPVGDFTVHAGAKFLFSESVSQLAEQKALLMKKQAQGHPLGNNGVKPGDHLIAQQSGDDKCVLLWASLPYTVKYQVMP